MPVSSSVRLTFIVCFLCIKSWDPDENFYKCIDNEQNSTLLVSKVIKTFNIIIFSLYQRPILHIWHMSSMRFKTINSEVLKNLWIDLYYSMHYICFMMYKNIQVIENVVRLIPTQSVKLYHIWWKMRNNLNTPKMAK